MKKMLLVALCAMPLMANAATPIKDAVEASPKYQAEKQQISNKLNKAKQKLQAAKLEKLKAEGKLKDKAEKAKAKYQDKVDQAKADGKKLVNKVEDAKKLTDAEYLKDQANRRIKKEKRKAIKSWLVES